MADRARLRRAVWWALAIALVLCIAGVFQHGLWTPDEPREAEIGREMLESRFSAMPTLSGEPFLEKPPLYAWITAAIYSAFGVSAGAARVPSTLFSIGAILVAYLMGKRAAGRVAGLCSAIVLATMWQFSETSHKGVLDTALTFFVAAGHLAFLRLRDGRGVAAYVAIGALSGLAFLTKAWIGPALLCAPSILAWAAMRDWASVTRVLPRAAAASMLGVAVLGLPWVLALAHTPGGGWAAVKECLVTEYVGRTVGGAEFAKQGHANGPLYYTYTALVVLAPWCLAIPAMVKGGALSRTWRGGRTLWCALVFLAGVVLLSIPTGKRDLYLVPLMPAAAVAVGVWLSRVGSRRGGAWDARTNSALFRLAYTVATLFAVSAGVAGAAIALQADVARERLPGAGPLLGVWLWLGALMTIGLIEFARRRPVPAARTAGVLASLLACVGLYARPAVDPLKDMEAGAKEAASLVPAGEPLLAFSGDETTLAVVPFYSRRLVANAEKPADAIRALEAGPSKHLLVMDKDVKNMGAALERRVALVRTVRFSATRDVDVYELKR